jgi:hypothetical protein
MTIEGWTDPLTVDPDERPAVTAANLAAIARHKERATQDRARIENR